MVIYIFRRNDISNLEIMSHKQITAKFMGTIYLLE